MTTTRTAALPVVALLSRLEAAYLAEFDRRLLDSEFCSLSFAHSRNVLRHLGDGPQRAGRLVELAGVTKQAISQQLVQLERAELVRTEPDPLDQRARLVALTERGERAQALVRQTFADIDDEWAMLLGAERFASLRDGLDDLLERVGPAEPPDTAC
ncbi:MarR family winged helix-turn-helix transcriptional regulator [Pseudactinotalea sp.]|uniref:MarR family winged helix-turn-helix transcriptional regulator n=1 Tax=Pseudactinotalea sp. TaxID=1926260 RepID=UPI003B3B5C0D